MQKNVHGSENLALAHQQYDLKGTKGQVAYGPWKVHTWHHLARLPTVLLVRMHDKIDSSTERMRGDKAIAVYTLSSSDADLRITSSIVAGERDNVEGIVVLTE